MSGWQFFFCKNKLIMNYYWIIVDAYKASTDVLFKGDWLARLKSMQISCDEKRH